MRRCGHPERSERSAFHGNATQKKQIPLANYALGITAFVLSAKCKTATRKRAGGTPSDRQAGRRYENPAVMLLHYCVVLADSLDWDRMAVIRRPGRRRIQTTQKH
jgi:hypothetical protein